MIKIVMVLIGWFWRRGWRCLDAATVLPSQPFDFLLEDTDGLAKISALPPVRRCSELALPTWH